MSSLHPLPLRVRARQIALILTHHGLGYLVGMLGLEQFVPFHKGWLKNPRRDHPYTRPEHVRMAMEDLGPTCIKLGQMISTRTDLVPPTYQAELVKLQDAAPVIAIEKIEQVLRDELGAGPDKLFATFDRTPLAAASIRQAHAATLPDGTEVVVKIRHPGVIEKIEADLELLHHLALALGVAIAWGHSPPAPSLVSEAGASSLRMSSARARTYARRRLVGRAPAGGSSQPRASGCRRKPEDGSMPRRDYSVTRREIRRLRRARVLPGSQ